MRLITHIVFNGQCEAAFKVYAECLGGEITFLLTYAESPMAASAPDLADKIVHATLKLGDQTLTGVDVSAAAYEAPRGFNLQLNLNDAGDAQRIFETLAEGGEVRMPLQKTFWAEHFAVLVDRFGVPWEINCGPGA